MVLRSETKTCPVCSAAVFADMDTCFNCMHRFGGEGASEPTQAVDACRGGCGSGACTDGAVKISGEALQDLLDRTGACEVAAVDATSESIAAQTASCSMHASAVTPGEESIPDEMTERRGQACLLGEFLVQFEGFLRDFLVDGDVDVQQG